MINKVKLTNQIPWKPILSATQTQVSPETTQMSKIQNQATKKNETTYPTVTLQTIDSNSSKDSNLS